MLGNALRRSGVQINFWQSKSGRREDLRPGAIDHAGILDFWLLQK